MPKIARTGCCGCLVLSLPDIGIVLKTDDGVNGGDAFGQTETRRELQAWGKLEAGRQLEARRETEFSQNLVGYGNGLSTIHDESWALCKWGRFIGLFGHRDGHRQKERSGRDGGRREGDSVRRSVSRRRRNGKWKRTRSGEAVWSKEILEATEVSGGSVQREGKELNSRRTVTILSNGRNPSGQRRDEQQRRWRPPGVEGQPRR